MSPITNTSGCPGQRQLGRDHDPPGRRPRSTSPSAAPSGEAFTPAAQITVLAVIRPGSPAASTSRPSGSMPTARTPSRTSIPSQRRSLLRPRRQPLRERLEHALVGVQQHDPRLRGVHRPVLGLQDPLGELGDLPGHLHAGRARADDRERHPRQPLLRGLRRLGQLERAEDHRAQPVGVVDRLHPGREHRPVVAPEVGVRRARGQDQRVVVHLEHVLGVHAHRRADRGRSPRPPPAARAPAGTCGRCRAARARSARPTAARSPPGRAAAGRRSGSCGRSG